MESLRRIITRLNGTLTEDELDVLNEILIWMHADRGTITVSLLQAVLVATRGTRYRVRAWMRSKFRELLGVHESGRVWPIYKIEDMQAAMPCLPAPTEEHAIKPPAAVSREELYAVEKLLQAHCGTDLYKRVQFAEFFENTMTKTTQHLRIPSEVDSHMHILKACLDSLCHPDQSLSPLRLYAIDNFAHMLPRVDLSHPQRSLLRYLGDKLSIMFSDTKVIDEWCPTGRRHLRCLRSLTAERNWAHLVELLGHEYTRDGYSSDSAHHQWLRAAIESDGHPSRV